MTMDIPLTALHPCHHSCPEVLSDLCSTSVHVEEVNTNGAVVECEKLGFSIAVPPGAVKCPVTISVSCSFREEFRPPNGYEFVSPVYLLHIDPEVAFLEKVTLSLHHWAKPSVCSLSFGFCQFPITNTAYTFQVEEGGDFPSNEHYGTIGVDHFSGRVIMRIRRIVRRITQLFVNQGYSESVFFL